MGRSKGHNFSEISQREKDKNTVWSYLYVESKTKQNKKTELIDTENKSVVAKVGGWAGGETGEGGQRYKLPVIK